MSDNIDTRVSLDLHPGNIEGMDVYDDDTRPVLEQAIGLLRSTHSALVAIHDAKAAAETDPTLTPEARLLKTDDYANKRMEPVTRAWDRAASALTNNIAMMEQEMAAPLVAKTAQSVSAEIRSHFKSLKTGERVVAIQAAIAAGDESTVAAVCAAPPYLSGLTGEMQAAFVREWNEKVNPLSAKRLRAMVAAKEYLDRCGGLILKEASKAVGVIEETREDKNGRRMVVRTITPDAIRAKRDKANAAFALPTN